MSRTTNSLRNAGVSVLSHLLTAVMSFACRTVFIYTLGREFLGISSLYTNVLTILSISELGLSTVITYRLYLPLKEGDHAQICALMDFFRKAYRVIGAVVLVLGLALMPFLPHLMNGVTDKVNIYVYYLLYLAQSVVSYGFFSYKSILLIADQKKYLTDLVTVGCRAVVNLLQIAVLVIWRSFFLYTVLHVLSVMGQNIVSAILADRRYPYLRAQKATLDRSQRRLVFSDLYAAFLQKVSVAIGTSTDNLIISAFVGIVQVGLYNNYLLIISTIQTFLSGISQALTASIGNLLAGSDARRSREVFRKLSLLNSYLICLCSVCFLVLLRPFILLWAGEAYLLDTATTVVIVLNFATNHLQSVVLNYRSAAGLFVHGKYRSVINAVLNLGLSLILVRDLGMMGVFLGSVISRLVTVWWYDGWLVCRRVFQSGPWWYYGSCGLCLVLTGVCWLIAEWLCSSLPNVSWWALFVRLAACLAVTCTVYLLAFGRSREWHELLNMFRSRLRRRGGK